MSRDIIVAGFVERVKAGKMTLEQVPEIYREEVQTELKKTKGENL